MTEAEVFDRKLVLVEYPAVVENVDKMLDTLNGIEEISQTYAKPTKKLELRFRPKDTFCKCVYGSRFNCTGILMKVKRRRYRRNGEVKEEFTVSIEGSILCAYRFRGMADFQYLPMEKRDDGKYYSILSQLIPEDLPSVSWVNDPAPLFILPHYFSRIDMPTQQPLKEDTKKTPCEDKSLGSKDHVSGTTRYRRVLYAVFQNFDSKTVPCEPNPEAVKNLERKMSTDPELAELNKKLIELFSERPIWTKNALHAKVRGSFQKLKHILPVVAYYNLTGPFRTAWVKFGFDPRKNPSTKVYQILDFRVRTALCGSGTIACKRSCGYLMANKSVPVSQQSTFQVSNLALEGGVEGKSNQDDNSAEDEFMLTYAFVSGKVPKCRQLYYHLCDVHLDSVQKLVHRNDGKETVCKEKDGWCEEGVLTQCRAVIYEDLRKTLNLNSEEITAEEKENSDYDDLSGDEEDDDLNMEEIETSLDYIS